MFRETRFHPSCDYWRMECQAYGPDAAAVLTDDEMAAIEADLFADMDSRSETATTTANAWETTADDEIPW